MTPLIIADGDIATTSILARALMQGYGAVEQRALHQLFGAIVDARPVFISRVCHPAYAWLPRYLRSRGVRYAYFLDDNFWELTADVDPGLATFYQNPAVLRVLDDYVQHAQVVVVMSRRLGAYIAARHPAAQVRYVVPGFDVAAVEPLLRAQPARGRGDGVVRVAYPTSRRPGVTELLVKVFSALIERHGPRIEVEFVGWAPDAVLGLPGVRLYPHIDGYEAYLRFAVGRQWDIGIAPLAGQHFESFKTQVKYREYGGLRIAGVYTRLAPYVDYVRDHETGVLVDNAVESWITGIDFLVADAQARMHIGAAAHQDVVRHHNQIDTARELAAIGAELMGATTVERGTPPDQGDAAHG